VDERSGFDKSAGLPIWTEERSDDARRARARMARVTRRRRSRRREREGNARVIIYERKLFNYSEQGHSIYTRKRRARALTDACTSDELT